MDIANKLVYLTRQIRLKTGEQGGFGFGGRDGYGIEFENDVFMMKPFCWCDNDDCEWCNGDKPNFLYKETDSSITWYKYIGRSMEYNDWNAPGDWLEHCINSIFEEDDCWYEYDITPRSLSEGLIGRDEGKIILNFCVSDPNATIEFEPSVFFDESSAKYFNIDDLINDINNSWSEETEIYQKAIKLDKKFPCLREKIKKNVLKSIEDEIKWLKNKKQKLIKE